MDTASQKPKVLVTFIESGFGHIVSAKAITNVLEEKYGNQIDIENCYVMQESNNKHLKRMENFLISQVKLTNKHPAYGFGIFYFINLCGGYQFGKFINKTLFRSATKALMNFIESKKPDVIVSTHYYITYVCEELKKTRMPNLVVINYNSENNVHIWWDRRADVFINNNSRAVEEAIKKRKFRAESVKQVNFSVRNEIVNANVLKETCREKYNIPNDDFVITVADGAYSSGKLKQTVKELLKLDKKFTLIALCAKNVKLYEKFLKLNSVRTENKINFMPLPFIEKGYEIFKASDMVITKAGPNTILDCIFMETPVMVNYYAHSIEKSATEIFIDDLKCGERLTNKKLLIKRVNDFIDNPDLLKVYKENEIKHFSNAENGANQIAEICYEQMKKAGLLK